MQVNSNLSDRYYTPYKTNTNVKAISGFSLNADGKIEFGEVSEAQEGKGFIAEFVDYQKFHKEWMSQGSATAFSYTTNKGLNSETEFMESMDKAEGTDGGVTKQQSEIFSGDMVILQPPTYSGFHYDSSISSKSKEEMTLDEYKQWFMNEMSQMPVSAWYRSTCIGGELIITDEAFSRMKSDPEWEKTVTNMIRKMYSSNGIIGSKMIGYQVIGASPEECYGEGIPVKSRNASDSNSDDEKSWWEKRHEGLEEILKEQAKRARNERAARREQIMQEWEQQAFESRQKMTEYFNSRTMGINQIYGTEVPQQIVASAMTAYDKSIIKNIIGSRKEMYEYNGHFTITNT